MFIGGEPLHETKRSYVLMDEQSLDSSSIYSLSDIYYDSVYFVKVEGESMLISGTYCLLISFGTVKDFFIPTGVKICESL
jgi:hypothetical protein